MIGSIQLGGPSRLAEFAMSPPSGTGASLAAPSTSQSFGEVLQSQMVSAASALRSGEAAAVAGIEGGIPLQTMVDRVLAAERSLQAAVAVRDKVVSSYLEISRMQI